jgi:hypothetical protein
MKKSFVHLLFRVVFLCTILFWVFLIITLLQIEFEILRGETNFFMGIVKSVFVLLLLHFSFYLIKYFGKESIEQEHNEHTTAS